MHGIDRRWLIFGAVGILLFVFGLVLANTRSLPRTNDSNQLEANIEAIKIGITKDGIYRLTSKDLQEQGLNLEQLEYTNLNLSLGGKPVRYYLDNDGLVFFGEAPNSRYSPYRSYLLKIGEPGLPIDSVSPTREATMMLSTVSVVIHYEENNLYDSRTHQETSDGELVREPWYWNNITVADRKEVVLTVDRKVKGPVTMAIALWGVTSHTDIDNDHDLDITVNSTPIGSVRWDGEGYFVGELSVSSELINQGENVITLDNRGPGATPVDIMHLDWIELTAQVSPQAIDDHLEIRATEGLVKPAGFSGPPLFLDITRADKPIILEPTFNDNKELILPVTKVSVIAGVGPTGYFKPDIVVPLRISNLDNPENQADLIIISPRTLSNDFAPLVEARQSQGLSVFVANLDEVNDVFGYGDPGPDSIASFLRFTHEKWQHPKPRYILLAGDSSYDYRGYLGGGTENMVPSPMVPVQFGGETVSDSRLADINRDGAPDMAIGRWPVSTQKELRAMIERTLAYERGMADSRALFAADGTDATFSSLNDDIATSSGFDMSETIRLVGPSSLELINAWNAGAWVITYIGHGSLERWGKEDIFSSDIVNEIRPASAPAIVLQLTCLTGFFAHPTIDSLSETMLLDPDGPVLLVAATSLTLSHHQRPFGVDFLQELKNTSVERIGDAFLEAKLSLDISNNAMKEISDTFSLLGDPSTLIIRPRLDKVQR